MGRCSNRSGELLGRGSAGCPPSTRAGPGTAAPGRGRLTQHDGVHGSPRAELDHDLQKTQGKVTKSRGAQREARGPRGPPPAPAGPASRSRARARQTLLPGPWGLSTLRHSPDRAPTVTRGSSTQRSCWGTSFSRKRKTGLPWKPAGSVNGLFSEARALPSPAGLSCSLVPSCQRPQVLRSTASV